MSEAYIDFCVDFKGVEGTAFATVEAIALVEHNNADNTDDFVSDIQSYWIQNKDGEYEALTDGLVRALDDVEDEISEQIFENLVEDLGLHPAQNEHAPGHHERLGRRFG